MNQMAAALKKASSTGALQGNLVTLLSEVEERMRREAVAAQRERLRAEEALRKEEAALVQQLKQERLYEEFHRRLRRTSREGLGSLLPCSLCAWPPAAPALAAGKPCRIRWGLSDGTQECVVVTFEYPQPIAGMGGMSTTLGFFSAAELSPCNCRGYVHKHGCTPRHPPTNKPKQHKQQEEEE